MDAKDKAHVRALCGVAAGIGSNIVTRVMDALDAAERERDALLAMLRNLLARVHRDGGQHVDAVGLDAATEEADEIIVCDRAELARLRAPRPSAIVLRPVEDVPETDAPLSWDDEDLALADGDLRALNAVTRERDDARAEAERLRTRLHRCACCGADESAVAACEGDEYPLCGPCAAGALREARAEAVAAREHTDRAVDEIRRTLPAALRLAAEDEREECAAIADEHADQEDVAGADACGRVAEAIRARGAGGGA